MLFVRFLCAFFFPRWSLHFLGVECWPCMCNYSFTGAHFMGYKYRKRPSKSNNMAGDPDSPF